MFDYEWATVQHTVNCRLGNAVVVPDVDPARAAGQVRRARQVAALRGAQGGVLPRGLRAGPRRCSTSSASIRRSRSPSSARRRRSRSITASRTTSSATCCWRLRGAGAGRRPSARGRAARRAGACRRLHRARARDRRAVADRLRRPRHLAGGTMNREAVALGTPVYTTFEGRLGAVDEELIATGRLRQLTSADEVQVVRRDPGAVGEPTRIRRDPRDAASRWRWRRCGADWPGAGGRRRIPAPGVSGRWTSAARRQLRSHSSVPTNHAPQHDQRLR